MLELVLEVELGTVAGSLPEDDEDGEGAVFLGVGVKVWKLMGIGEEVVALELLDGCEDRTVASLELAPVLEGTAKVLAGPLARVALTVPLMVVKTIGWMTVVLGWNLGCVRSFELFLAGGAAGRPLIGLMLFVAEAGTSEEEIGEYAKIVFVSTGA